jgi:hypothetical protein
MSLSMTSAERAQSPVREASPTGGISSGGQRKIFSDARSAALINSGFQKPDVLLSPKTKGALPTATVGVDTTGDGRANYLVHGVDTNLNGIPDVLESSRPKVLSPRSYSPSSYSRFPTLNSLPIGLTGDPLLEQARLQRLAHTTPFVGDPLLEQSRVHRLAHTTPFVGDPLLEQSRMQRLEYVQSLELHVRNLTSQVNEKSAMLLQQQSQMNAMQTNVDQVTASNVLYDTTLSGKDAQIADLRTDLSSKMAFITELEMRSASLSSSFASNRDSFIAREQALSAELQTRTAAIQADMNTEIARRDADIRAKHAEIATLQARMNDLQVCAGLKDSEALALRLEVDQSVQLQQQTSFMEIQNMRASFESQLAEMKSRLLHIEMEKNRSDSRIAELETERSVMYSRLSETQTALQIQSGDARLAAEEAGRLRLELLNKQAYPLVSPLSPFSTVNGSIKPSSTITPTLSGSIRPSTMWNPIL